MGLFLKNFENHTQYENYINGSDAILPNVSLITDNNTVHYNPSTPPTPSHDYVEIGGVKWAAMNVGANSVTDYGLYFQWGDTQGYTAAQVGEGEGQKYFDLENYKYWTSDTGSGSSGFTKYNSTDSKTVLDASDDAVKAAWGGSWRTPTKDEYVSLGNAVNSVWTADYQGSGVAGLVCTDKTDNSKELFFPAAGRFYQSSDSSTIGSYGYYLSSTLYSSNIKNIYSLLFGSSNLGWDNYYGVRQYGLSVRGILDN
jgi:hypothetical protein